MINLEKHLKTKGIRVNYTQSTNVFPRIYILYVIKSYGQYLNKSGI